MHGLDAQLLTSRNQLLLQSFNFCTSNVLMLRCIRTVDQDGERYMPAGLCARIAAMYDMATPSREPPLRGRAACNLRATLRRPVRPACGPTDPAHASVFRAV